MELSRVKQIVSDLFQVRSGLSRKAAGVARDPFARSPWSGELTHR